MARKSAAALSIVAGRIDGRPKAPSDLNQFQRDLWTTITSNEAVDMFKTAVCQQLLKEFCRHTDTAEKLTRKVNEAMAGEELPDLEALDRLLRMRDRETKAAVDKATKLRLTNQARYTTRAAATAAKSVGSEAKPWDRQA